MVNVVDPECLTWRIRWPVQEVAIQLLDESIAVVDRIGRRLNGVIVNRDGRRGWQRQARAVARVG